jgi:hypothetical protein
LESLSTEAGLRFEVRQELPDDLIADRVSIVVIDAPVNGLNLVAESSPSVQFVAFGQSGMSPSDNLTLIEPMTERLDQVGFLGGYTAALVSQDWRVASVTQLEGTIGATTRVAFANGARFLCGLCRPKYPPYPGFPVDYPYPTQGDSLALESTLTQIEQDQVEIVFLQPGVVDSEMVDSLAAKGIRLIGVDAPGADTGSTPAWIATLEGDPARAVTSVWPAIVEGESRGRIGMPLRVTVYDPAKLTPGRLRQVQTMIDDLEGGFVDTGVNSPSGNSQ